MLHPDVTFVHGLYQFYVLKSDRAYVEALHALEESRLLNLSLDLGPDLMQCRVVSPIDVFTSVDHVFLWECMPEDHDCEDRLNDQMVRLDKVAQLSVLLERRGGRLCRVLDELGEELVDPYFA